MSDAVDEAAVVCFGVSAACESVTLSHRFAFLNFSHRPFLIVVDKESSNCRLVSHLLCLCVVRRLTARHVLGIGGTVRSPEWGGYAAHDDGEPGKEGSRVAR